MKSITHSIFLLNSIIRKIVSVFYDVTLIRCVEYIYFTLYPLILKEPNDQHTV